MKYSMDTYRLYYGEKRFASSIRVKVTMKEAVNIEILRVSANIAIKRYPYFAVKVTVDEDGGFVLRPNLKRVAVLPLAKKTRLFCSNEVNEHLLFLEVDGRDIFFNISHSLCGGRGAFPWLMTTVYQYVKDAYHVEPYAPGIRKPGEPLLPGETAEPSLDLLLDEPPIYTSKSKNPVALVKDYMNGLYNPFARYSNYRVFGFKQKDIMAYARDNDASVASLFLVITGKALDRVLPAKAAVIGGEIAHSPTAELGIPNTHCDILTHAYIDYERDQLKWDMEKLGTMTRGQIILQTDPTVSSHQLREIYSLFGQLDQVSGLKNKMDFMQKNNPSTGKDARHGTYLVNYTGRMDWGEVADYVESYAAVVEGHCVLEITSLEDRIFVTFMQLLRNDKYIRAFKSVLEELGIPYTVEGPFPKHLSKHQLPV